MPVTKRNFFSASFLAGTALGSLTFGSAPALAQDSDQTEQTQEAGADTGGLGEIIVTAQKRSESLQKVPISIAAFDTAKHDGAGISDTQRLPAAVPGPAPTHTGSLNREHDREG